MSSDPARAEVHPVSPATWTAAAALVLILGALGLFLMGCETFFPLEPPGCADGQLEVNGICVAKAANHYTCECQCTKGFAAGTRVSAVGLSIPVRDGAGGPLSGSQPGGSQGAITQDLGTTVVNGVTVQWWQVNFDTGVDGAVEQPHIAVLPTEIMTTSAVEICLPAEFNPNRAEFDHVPTSTEIGEDCSVRVLPRFVESVEADLPPGSTCTCQATSVPTTWVNACDGDCPEPPGVCTVPADDSESPTPLGPAAAAFSVQTVQTVEPVEAAQALPAAALLGPTSTCEVTGSADLRLGDEFKRTNVAGTLYIHGAPCPPGQPCSVGISYELRLDPISFSVRFHKDPKFVDLAILGASTAQGIALGPVLGPLYGGSVAAGATLNSVRGRREGKQEAVAMHGRNGGPLNFAVDWENKRCLLDGGFIGGTGGVEDDDGNVIADVEVHMTVGGQTDLLSQMVNQPPRANAGADQTLECTSPEGAPVTLNAGGSTDADGNIAFYVWRHGSSAGAQVAPPSPNPVVSVQNGLGQGTYHLRVVDSRLAAGTDTVNVTIADTTAPTIDCHAPPVIPKHDQPISFKATAADTCSLTPTVVVESFECFKVSPEGRIKDNPSCKGSILGDTLTIGNSAGADLIRWTTLATDPAGNVARKICEVSVD